MHSTPKLQLEKLMEWQELGKSDREDVGSAEGMGGSAQGRLLAVQRAPSSLQEFREGGQQEFAKNRCSEHF